MFVCRSLRARWVFVSIPAYCNVKKKSRFDACLRFLIYVPSGVRSLPTSWSVLLFDYFLSFFSFKLFFSFVFLSFTS